MMKIIIKIIEDLTEILIQIAISFIEVFCAVLGIEENQAKEDPEAK